MSVKETVHKWIDEMAEDSPGLMELYEQARLDRAISEAKKAIQEGRVLTWEEADRRMKEKWAKRDSRSN
ncbi:MAG TPA: hypothetical protein VEO95_12245 [Chthoniobacteraceae bacterium]|nr:hypothetical protein [Chthoniobacteraceae bacterium]